ncbi:MAG TPA: 23S rRNA (adenine(2030)-N(6))-methyltransferase RlmJ [Actinomycetota bacterium]|nr:23S rRNA (adenine(2030)-N(6))-methyltransferase RlmJ [Actinomycetota bacterium]
MANPHFGEIGDVWKHLVLGDVLDRVRPSRYWETHAGSGTYPLDRSWEREYGVFRLLREAPRAPAIAASRFLGLVRTLPPGDDGAERYPGSPRLAMEVLGGSATYLLCDLDPASVADLTRTARELDLQDLVRAERADGLATAWASAQALAPDAATATLVLLDPFDATERSVDDMDSLDLFARLASGGFPTLMWLGYDDAAGRDGIRARARVDGAPSHLFHVDTAHLRGETTLNPGAPGCGMLLANVPVDVVDHVERLGRQLAACYDEALMPDGTPGGLRFMRVDLT